MAISTLVSGINRGTAVCVLAGGDVVVGTGQGLDRYDPGGSLVESSATGAIAGVAAHPTDPGSAFATIARRGLYEVRFGAAPGLDLRAGIRGARGVAVDAFSGEVLVTSMRSPGRLVEVPADPAAALRVAASGLVAPAAVARRSGAADAYVLSRTTSARILRVDVATGVSVEHIAGLGRARDLAWADAAGSRLAVADLDGRILLVDLADPGAAPVVLADGFDPVWSIDLADAGRLVAGVGQDVLLVDLPAADPVTLGMPSDPIYLSSWARVGVATDGSVAFEDLLFVVDPPEGGVVSHARDATFSASPSVILATCAVPGQYKLVVLHGLTGDVLASAPFDVTDVWGEVDGPPRSFIGSVGADGPEATWGGGDPYVPQNLSVTPVRSDRNVAVVIAQTTETPAQPALTNAQQTALRTTWRNEVFAGVNRGGVMESVRNYWFAVNGSRFDMIDAGVVGPVTLANTWASYATSVNTTSGQTDGWEAFGRAAVADIRRQNETLAAAGQPPVVDLMTVDSIILVLRSLPAAGMNPGRFVWPSATRPGGYQLSFEVGRSITTIPTPFGSITISLPIERTIQMFAMPDDWVARDARREIGETAAHEYGHNLGLPDEYPRAAHPQWAKDRDLARRTTNAAGQTVLATGDCWSLMSFEEEFPLPTVVEKMMLGWVDAAHVKLYNFQTIGPVNETVTLHASDLGTPPAGRFSAIEVRIGDGSNYYFEYRREQPTAFFDQDIPTDRTVVGVDVRSGAEPSDRRNILRIQNDTDNDRGEFQLNDDYEERDTSNPSYPEDFRMEVLETAARFARVRITYGDSKPDPQIRPWAPSTNWKSPDLRVTNARNATNSAWRDIPWEGHDNRIVATVRNPGQISARSVRVEFFVKDFTLGSGAEQPLGFDVHDVPTGNTPVEFTSSVPWVPPPLSAIPFVHIQPHYCVVARIVEYRDPTNPAIRETTPENNEAQSNHTQLISVSASPSSREMGVVKVTNPLDEPAVCRVVVRQASPYYRTYVEKSWVRLEPGGARDVLFMTESILGDPTTDPAVGERREAVYKQPNSVRLTGVADTAGLCHGFVTGGAHVLVRSARATEFVEFGREGELVWGRVVTRDDGSGVNGPLLVTLTPEDAPEKEQTFDTTVVNGDFRLAAPPSPRWRLQGHFLGGFDSAPCTSKPLWDE